MNLSPQASGSRPRVACEITSQGVVAGRSVDAAAPLAAVAKADLRSEAVVPGLKPGNIADRVHVIAAIRKVIEGVGLRANTRGADLTLIIPDAAVRVLLLEFESLPSKLSEALPLVRFRLKKLLPFEADDAMVTFQVMSHGKTLVRVLAVAIPRDVLAEYETAVREAGFEPGAVLPSTLAALAGISDTEPAALLVNANRLGITTAIVREGILLLHRSMDLQEHGALSSATLAGLPAALFEGSEAHPNAFPALPLVSVDDTQAEWAAQQALPEHGRNPYADRAADEEAVQNEDGITGLPVPLVYAAAGTRSAQEDAYEAYRSRPSVRHAAEEAGYPPGAVAHSPYAGVTVKADLNSEVHNSEFYAPTSAGTLTEDRSGLLPPMQERAAAAGASTNGFHTNGAEPLPRVPPAADAHQQDVSEAVSVAAAYFEDTLSTAPQRVLSAGPLGAEALRRALQVTGVGGDDGLQVRELVESSALLADAVSAGVPRGWLAGVMGALRS